MIFDLPMKIRDAVVFCETADLVYSLDGAARSRNFEAVRVQDPTDLVDQAQADFGNP